MKLLIFWLVAISAFLVGAGAFMTIMPGQRVAGALPPLSSEEEKVADSLEEHVDSLARTIQNRAAQNLEGTAQAIDYLERQMTRAGYEVRQTPFESRRGMSVNLEATRQGANRKSEYILIAAHYDCEPKSAGAHANASGCAVLIELARLMLEAPCDRSLRFVLLANGSESWAGDEHSGAASYARELRKRGEKVVMAFALDGLGYFKDTPGSQSVPFPLNFAYPDTANFVLFAGDLGSRDLVREVVQTFRAQARFPGEGIAVPGFFPGYDSSDHAPFAATGIKSILVTDTGKLRFAGSNTPSDLPAVLDYKRMARVTIGMSRVVTAMAKSASLL